jgi:hypothetical protein
MTRNEHPSRHPVRHAPAAGRHAHHVQEHHYQQHHHDRERHQLAHERGGRRSGGLRRVVNRFLRRRFVRRLLWVTGVTFAVGIVGVLGLWWRLSNGPIELDVATPWLKAAIEENFGANHTVLVGGTQIERDETGRTSLRLRDIVVRDADGTVVASAPKAEVGISGVSLLSGKLRAVSLNLVGAEMAVRIEKNGSVTVFAGANKRPIATALPALTPAQRGEPAESIVPQGPLRTGVKDIAGILAWIDGLGATGLDGHDLRELGLKNGNLTVDDQRNGKHWTFSRINVSLTRPAQGGIIFRLASENPERPWVLSAAMRPLGDGVRAVGIEARHVASRDILLAMRLNEGNIEPDLPLSASVRADIAADGSLQQMQGQIIADSGMIFDRENDKANIKIDHADVRFSWDPQRHALVVPFQVHSGGNQFTMRAMLESSPDKNGLWLLSMSRGDTVIDPVILASPGASKSEGFAINRATMRARIDTVRKRIDLEQGDFSRVDTRPSHNVGVAITGSLDYSHEVPHLAFGFAGTRMPVDVLKRIWPIFAATDVRAWVEDHISGGTVERIVVAGNAPLPTFKANGPPVPDDGLSVDIETSGTSLRPLDTLPAIRDADLTVRVIGRNASVSLGRGTVEVAPGRKLSVTSGIFVVPDTHPKPAPARTSFRIDGSVPAAATLLASDALRDNAGLVLDPASSRGTVAAQVAINLAIARVMPKEPPTYSITADLTNFSADKLLLGRKVEASSLRVTASRDGYQVKGDVKINSTPASISLTKTKDDPAAELKLQAVIDEAARRRLGIDLGDSVSGTIPVKVSAQVGSDSPEVRMNVEADLSPLKVDNLLPGWVKPAGKPAHAAGVLIRNGKSFHFNDLTISGPGAMVKGSVELDDNSDIVSAYFPVFSLSDGDKVTLKADRGSDGVLRVAMHGDVYDGRNFVKASLAGHAPDKANQKQADLDLDIRIGTVAGHNGETLRGLDLKLQRRNGRIRHFTMKSKIGRDTPLNGDLRLRASDKHQVIYFETEDAGALFRFTDMYPRMFGGRMWVAMDPPTQEQSPQIGTLNIRNFVVRGEPALDRVVAGAPGQQHGSVDFNELRADFTRYAGKMSVREGIVRGPLVGVTVEGQIDYVRNAVHLRGTFVPFYGLNNMFGQIPIVGLFLGGGSKEGLLGITYEAVGPPGSPRITVNPVTAIAPGLLRKFIPSPGTFDRDFIPSSR